MKFRSILRMFLLSTAVAIMACSQEPQQRTNEPTISQKLLGIKNPEKFEIVKDAFAIHFETGKAFSSFWNPTNEELYLADQITKKCFSAMKDTFYIEKNIDSYIRKYVPVIDSNGKKIIWGYGDCSASATSGVIEPVFDGGNCYFNLFIDVESRTYYDFVVHGEA